MRIYYFSKCHGRHFHIHFVVRQVLYIDPNFTEIYCQVSSWPQAIIGSDNDLIMIWTTAGLF